MFKQMFRSKKFTAMVTGFLLVIMNDKFGWNVSPEAVENVLKFLGVYILGQSAADGLSGGNTSSVRSEIIEETSP